MPDYVASRFVSMSFSDDGSLTLHSARTGAIGVVEPDRADRARDMLRATHVTRDVSDDLVVQMIRGGFLVPSEHDEDWESKSSYIRRYASNSLHLIIMPTEDCNFRCVYCYESFLRKGMTNEMQAAIIKHVESKLDLESLEISWFGGEPLLELQTVLSITSRLSQYCDQRKIDFKSSATTNGYLLTPESLESVVGSGVTNFQITLDGLEHDHDERRPGRNGERTFSTILENLRHAASTDLKFHIILRHNFDPGNLERVDEFLDVLANEFGNDPRFTCNFQAIGRWGGADDADLNVCEGRVALDSELTTKSKALERGLRDATTFSLMQPQGSTCYAANPNSFVIGSDGKLYKCTVELDYHDRNIVGQLLPDGSMDLDWRKMALWCETDGEGGDKKCTSCWFKPSCHGAACPKEWLDDNDCNCPPVKRGIQGTLAFIRADAVKYGPPQSPSHTHLSS